MSDDACQTPGCGHAGDHHFSERLGGHCFRHGCPCTAYLPPRPVPEEACVCGHERQHHPSGLVAIPVSTEWDECPGCRICDHQYPHDHNECDVPSRAASVPAPHAEAEAAEPDPCDACGHLHAPVDKCAWCDCGELARLRADREILNELTALADVWHEYAERPDMADSLTYRAASDWIMHVLAGNSHDDPAPATVPAPHAERESLIAWNEYNDENHGYRGDQGREVMQAYRAGYLRGRGDRG